MQMNIMAQLVLILPELLLAFGAVALLIVGAFVRNRSYTIVTSLALLLLAVAMFILLVPQYVGTAFGHALILDAFSRYAKLLSLASAFVVLIMSIGAAHAGKFDKFEFPVLVLLASLGMLLMVSAGNMLSLYLGLELHSLALYIMASLDRHNARSTEAGLKYFVLGSLASGLLLYGISLLYGYSGHIDFHHIYMVLNTQPLSLGLIFGIVFALAGLTFKISAVPFHMWTPDVYQGAPTPITAFFATASKVAAIAMLTRVVISSFGGISPLATVAPAWQQIIIFMALASMFWGAFAGIAQQNIKRLMAYSSITHVGYILVGLSSGSILGVQSVLLYLTIYVVMVLGCFAFILAMQNEDGYFENINDLAGLARTKPLMAGVITFLMFSLAGIPPLSGFFGKWYVFSAAVEAKLVPLVVAGVIAAVIAAFYYLRILKIIWFDEPKDEFLNEPKNLRWIMLIAVLFTVFYSIFGAWFMTWTEAAAKSLF